MCGANICCTRYRLDIVWTKVVAANSLSWRESRRVEVKANLLNTPRRPLKGASGVLLLPEVNERGYLEAKYSMWLESNCWINVIAWAESKLSPPSRWKLCYQPKVPSPNVGREVTLSAKKKTVASWRKPRLWAAHVSLLRQEWQVSRKQFGSSLAMKVTILGESASSPPLRRKERLECKVTWGFSPDGSDPQRKHDSWNFERWSQRRGTSGEIKS